jgi:hypothetical protein
MVNGAFMRTACVFGIVIVSPLVSRELVRVVAADVLGIGVGQPPTDMRLASILAQEFATAFVTRDGDGRLSSFLHE